MAPRLLSPALAVALAAAPVASPAPARAGEGRCDPGPALLVDGFGTPDEELARLAELTGRAPAGLGLLDRAGARLRPTCAEAVGLAWAGRSAPAPGEGLAVLPARLTSLWNAAYPTSGNDGLLWAGRGASMLSTGGVAARWGPLSAALAPEVAWQQNRWFATQPTGLPGDGAFANPWNQGRLDLPQRFGAGPFASAAWGRSFLRAEALGAAAGFSTEGLWWGPGRRDALLLAGSGPGFPHLFLGTAAPVETPIGAVEALAIWGRLERSRYDGGGPRHAWLSGLALGWGPRWVPGLSVGVGRLFVQSWASLKADRFLSVLEPPFKHQVRGGDNPADNQLTAAWWRWIFPEVGLALFGEWGRDDFPASLAGLTRSPERTAGWVLGLEKVGRAGDRLVRLQVEACSLFARQNPSIAAQPFYTHYDGLDATHRGQLLGAMVGPGGDGQWLAVDVLGPGGRVGAYLERIRRNEDTYWERIAPVTDSQNDAELTAGVRQLLFLGPAEVAWHVAGAYRWNRDFLRSEPNLQLGLSVAVPFSGSTVR